MGKESQLLEAARDGNLPKVEVGGSLLRRGSPVLDHVLSVRQTASVRSRTYYTVMSLRWLQRLERKRLIYTDYTKCHIFVYSLKKLQSAQRPRQLVVCGVRQDCPCTRTAVGAPPPYGVVCCNVTNAHRSRVLVVP